MSMTHRYVTTKSQGWWTCGLMAAALTLLWPIATLAQTHSGPEITTEKANTGFLRQQDDVSAVTQVVLRERQARDRAWWDRMMVAYWPDSRVELSWYHGDGPGFVYASRKQFETGDIGYHRLGASVVDIRGNRADVEVQSRNWTQLQVDGKTVNLYADMRLNYRLEKRHGEWRIVFLNPIYEHSELAPDVPGETLSIPAEELAKFRPSYAALCWALRRKGLTLGQDEIGVDRPAGVAAFYTSVRQWMGE
jgi:hypothetical protein